MKRVGFWILALVATLTTEFCELTVTGCSSTPLPKPHNVTFETVDGGIRSCATWESKQ